MLKAINVFHGLFHALWVFHTSIIWSGVWRTACFLRSPRLFKVSLGIITFCGLNSHGSSSDFQFLHSFSQAFKNFSSSPTTLTLMFTITLMFHSFLVHWQIFTHLLTFFHFHPIVHRNSIIHTVASYFFLLILRQVFWSGLSDPFVSQNIREFYTSHSLEHYINTIKKYGRILLTRWDFYYSWFRDVFSFFLFFSSSLFDAPKY